MKYYASVARPTFDAEATEVMLRGAGVIVHLSCSSVVLAASLEHLLNGTVIHLQVKDDGRDTEPAPAICSYEDCDQDPDVTFKDGSKMCRFHAIDSLLSQATLEETRMIRNIFEKQWRDA